MGNYLRKLQGKRILAGILAAIMILTSVNLSQFVSAEAATELVTLYFVDNTAEQWVKNDNAKIKAIDNSNGHDSYWMTQIDDTTWSVKVPESAYNITFNRYSSDKATQWNSWSAGGRDENNAYYADGSEYGHWEVKEELGFQEGDIIYLDLTEFTEWEKDNASIYINFTNATKSENNGETISIADADKKLYNPKEVESTIGKHVYGYAVTKEDEGATELRFWRGNNKKLWNCSLGLSYNDFLNGLNCIKVTGWDDIGSRMYYEYEEVKISMDTSNMQFVESEEGDFYFIDDEIDSLSGTLTGVSSVEEVKYSIYDINGEILKHGNVNVKNEWHIDNIGLIIGYNLIKFNIKTKNDVIECQYIINNTNINNMKNLGISTDIDTDNDNLPDFYEELVKLNPNSKDTDGDGLDDFTELFLSGVSALSKDTDEDGILDGDEDSDEDGLTNLEEVALGTSLSEKDTDQDGLTDYEEVRVHYTDPLKKDTDGDGLNDGWEIKVGSDPLKFNNDFRREVTADSFEGQRTIPTVSISGLSAEQVTSLEISKVKQGMLTDDRIPGLLDCGYEFYVSGKFDKAEIKFEFDKKLLDNPDFYPAIYYFNEEQQILEEISGQHITGNVVSATVTHFSKYILLNKIEYDMVWDYNLLYIEDNNTYSKLDVVFVIDSSGSMSWNDPSDVRINVTKNFIDKLSENDRGAIIDFDSTGRILSGFTSDKEVLKNNAQKIDCSGGTNLSSGISLAINLFRLENYTERNTLKYVIMLTDGDGSYSTSYTVSAAGESIVIYTIGLGSDVSTSVLMNMASGTGGNYYHANNANQLYPIFDAIADQSDYYKDTDGDGVNDYFEKAMTSGQLLLGTGVPLGGMNYLDADSDNDNLTDGQEITVSKFGDRVYVKLFSNPTIKDTDGDGMQDDIDPRPLVYDIQELLVHQTRDREGIKKQVDIDDNTVADDLTFNDYSYWELLKCKPFPNIVAGVTPEAMMWGEMIPLFYVGGFFADSDMQDALYDMVDTFRNGNRNNIGKVVKAGKDGENGDTFDDSLYIKYKNSVLTDEVFNDNSTKSYVDIAKNFIVDELSKNNGDLSVLEYVAGRSDNLVDDYMNKIKISPYPKYTEKTNLALAIAIHQFQGHTITVTDYKCDGKEFSGKLQFHFYDHFGLDETDEIIYPGFCDWFVLQHYDRFNGKYVPFITTVDFSVDFSGTIY